MVNYNVISLLNSPVGRILNVCVALVAWLSVYLYHWKGSDGYVEINLSICLSLCWSFLPFVQKLNLDKRITFELKEKYYSKTSILQVCITCHIFDCNIVNCDVKQQINQTTKPSVGFKIYDLDLDFWPTAENFNHGHCFWIERDRAFILHVYSLSQDLSVSTLCL